MAWIESHQSIGRHPKLNKLRSLTGWTKHEAIGVLHDLWHWVLTYAEDGDIARFTSEEIALGIDIDPTKFDVKRFIDNMIEAGFVRKDLKIHDWMDYAGKYLTSKYRNHNPKKLIEIQKKYGKRIGRTKGVQRAQMDEAPTNLPNQHNITNITNLPEWVPREAWDGFIEMRKKAKSPFTGRALNLAISELEKLRAQGQDPGAVLNQSVMNGWKGLFPIKQGASDGAYKPNPQTPRTKAGGVAVTPDHFAGVTVRFDEDTDGDPSR